MKLISKEIIHPQGSGKMPVTPISIHKALNKRLAGLDDAKRFISTRIALHLRRARKLAHQGSTTDRNQCLLITGPSGSGKTFLVEQAAALTKIPFIAASAASITAEGFSGPGLRSVLDNLIKSAPNANLANYGICFLDEWDKRIRQNVNKQSFSLEIQGELLRMMEGTTVEIETRAPPKRKINTRGLMFVFAGAFEDLDQVSSSKTTPAISGFGHAPPKVSTVSCNQRFRDALIEYGMIPEFINRLSGILTLPTPTERDMLALLHFNNGPLENCNRHLRELGAELTIDSSTTKMIAHYACESKSYSRGIQFMLQSAMDYVIYEGIKGQIALEPQDMEYLTACDHSALHITRELSHHNQLAS